MSEHETTLSDSALNVLLRMANGEDLTDRDGECWFVRPNGMKNWESVPFQNYVELINGNMIRVAWRLFGGSQLEITPQGQAQVQNARHDLAADPIA